MNIDTILEMMNSNNPISEQTDGMNEAMKVRCLSVFLRPHSKNIGRNTWKNCALVLSQKSDEELLPIADDLLEWVDDCTLPGALIIAARLHNMVGNEKFDLMLKTKMRIAKKLEEDDWYDGLESFVLHGDFSGFKTEDLKEMGVCTEFNQ